MERRGRSIKTILIIMCVLAALIPVLAVGFYSMNLWTETLEEEITANNLNLARSLSGEIEEFLNEAHNTVQQVAQVYEEGALTSEQFGNYLEVVDNNAPFFEMVQILDNKGRTQFVAPRDEQELGLDMSYQPFYSRTLEEEGVVWSDSFISHRTGRPTLTVSLEMEEGMVVGYLSLDQLDSMVARIGGPDYYFVGITDGRGTFIGHTNPEVTRERVNVAQMEIVQEGLQGIEGNYRGPFYGEDILASVAPTEQTDWPVIVSRYAQEVFSPVDMLIRVFWIGGIMGIAIAIAIAIFNLRRIMQAFINLMHKVKQISGGNYELKVLNTGYREFNELSQHIRTMAAAIRSRERELRESEDWLETTLNSIGDAVIACDVEGYVRFMNPIAEKLTGWRESEARNRPIERVFHIIDEKSEKPSKNPIMRAIKEGVVVGLANHTILLAKDGRRIPIDDSAAPIRDEEGDLEGAVLVFRDITDRRQMERALQDSKTKIEKLHDVAISMERSQSEEDVCKLTVEAGEEILNFNICTLDLVEDGYLVPKATTVEGSESKKMPCDQGIAGKTYMEGKTIMLEDIQVAEGATPLSTRFRSAISVPVGDMGVFQVISTEEGAFGQEDRDLAELLISHTTEALKRIRSEQELRYVSFHDSLTTLYNRTFFEEEMKRLDTSRQIPLSIIISDVNGLKMTNDVFGHQEGDNLLKEVARIIKESCREEDIIARWGGDEFSVLLPGTGYEEAKRISERIKTNSEESQHVPLQPNISIGVSTKNSTEQDIEEVLKEAENEMYKSKLLESREVRSTIISSLQKNLAVKTFETTEHSEKMEELALKMGHELNLDKREMENLEILARVHDIGKIAIPEDIIKKEGPLDDEEWEIIKRHPEIGYRIAESSPRFSPVADYILTHHEHWDGGGYPQGLSGEEIPLLARIINIVEAYEVMTSGRPYKKAMSREEAFEELRRCAGGQFDPELVELFISLLQEEEKEE